MVEENDLFRLGEQERQYLVWVLEQKEDMLGEQNNSKGVLLGVEIKGSYVIIGSRGGG